MLENLLVVKVGSNSNFNSEENRLNSSFISGLCKEVAELYEQGTKPILVISGAVPIGMREYGFKEKPEDITDLQRCAAYGQPMLFTPYQRFLKENGLRGGQILDTYKQLEDKDEAQKLYNKLENFLFNYTIPLINYDDVNDDKEVRFDNDRNALEIAILTHAKKLLLLTDVDGLKDRKILIREIRNNPLNYLYLCTEVNSVSGGGMGMKLWIGKEAREHGITTYIGNSAYSLNKILSGNPATIIHPC